MSKPKLLIISPAKNLGGGEIYLNNLLPKLRQEYDITLMGPSFVKSFFGKEFRVIWLPLFPGFLDKTLRRTHQLKRLYYRFIFKTIYKIKRYDIVNVQWFDGALIEGIKKRPLILTLQTGFLIPRQYDAYVARVLNGIDRIICVSYMAMRQVVERGVDKNKITVIYNGLEPNRYKVNKKPGEFVTWAGRVEVADKNPGLFVEVAKTSQKQGLPYKFRIVGGGSYLSEIRKDCPSNLELTGAKQPNEMPEVYQQASILCMTSTSEGLPFVALEAMASGVPVVTTAVGGLNELLDKKAGVLINGFKVKDIVSAIDNLLTCPADYKEIQRRGRQKIETQFSINNMAKQTLGVYKGILK